MLPGEREAQLMGEELAKFVLYIGVGRRIFDRRVLFLQQRKE